MPTGPNAVWACIVKASVCTYLRAENFASVGAQNQARYSPHQRERVNRRAHLDRGRRELVSRAELVGHAHSCYIRGAAVLVRNATSAAKEEVWFLEGPYYISLERSRSSTWLVSLNDMDGFRYWEADVDGSSSFASIRAGAAALVSECTARSWQHPDIQILNDLLNASL